MSRPDSKLTDVARHYARTPEGVKTIRSLRTRASAAGLRDETRHTPAPPAPRGWSIRSLDDVVTEQKDVPWLLFNSPEPQVDDSI